METKLARISQLSKENPDMVFTSLGHRTNIEKASEKRITVFSLVFSVARFYFTAPQNFHCAADHGVAPYALRRARQQKMHLDRRAV